MRALFLTLILVSFALPGVAKFSDPECQRLIKLATNNTGSLRAKYTWAAYPVCYKEQPCDEECERSFQALSNVVQQNQISNLQRQQNLNTYLLLQKQ